MHRLVKLTNAINGAKLSMQSARMDSNKQTYEAIKMVLDCYDEQTAKDLRVAVKQFIVKEAE